MVADLGGGTSDFTIVRMSAHGFEPGDVLGVGGVAVAGDAIDGSLVRSAAAPHFGSRSKYRVVMGNNDLEMPLALVELLASPAELTLVDRGRVREQLLSIRAGLSDISDRPKIDRFVALVEDGLGFSLYESVERCKRQLSDGVETQLEVEEPSIAISVPMTRHELNTAATPPVSAISNSLQKTLYDAAVDPRDVEILCFTGGTSRMPLVAQSLQQLVPNATATNTSSFHAVVQGLARKARELESDLA